MNRVFHVSFTALFLVFLSACGGGNGATSTATGPSVYLSSGEWLLSGKYSDCANQNAVSELSVTKNGNTLVQLTYIGNIWKHDCSENTVQGSVELSGYELSEPLDIGELQSLLRIIYDDYEETRFTVSNTAATADEITFEIYDDFDDSLEIITFYTKKSSSDVDYTGSYSGTFSGDDSGTWSVNIDTSGKISGQAKSGWVGVIQVSGTISDGAMVFGGATNSGTTVTFNGNINPITGSVSGSWSTKLGNKGTYSGSKQ